MKHAGFIKEQLAKHRTGTSEAKAAEPEVKITEREPPIPGPVTALEKLTPSESGFLFHYYDANSLTKGEGKKSAIAAGYSDKTAGFTATRILKKHDQIVFAGALESVGMNRMTLALRLKRIIDDKYADNKEVLAATKMMLSVMGERTESGGTNVNVNVAAPKSLVFVGFDDKGVNDMLTGKKPKLLENNEAQGTTGLEQVSVASADTEA